MESKNVVLVTAIGTMTASAIVKVLKTNIHYYVLGANSFPANMTATSRDVDEFYAFPSVVDDTESYVCFARDFCIAHRVAYYFASIDEEVAALSRHRNEFEAIGVKLCVPNESVVSTCHYKNRFGEWIRENVPEVSVREYQTFADVDEKEFPVFVKPIEGRASIGCIKVESAHHAAGLLSKGLDESAVVIQEYLTGEHITVDLVRDERTSRVAMLARTELLRNLNGCGIAVETFFDEKLERICFKIAELLELNGVVNVEFFRRNGDYSIIEINPRFSAGTAYSCMAGLNTVVAAIEIAQGQGCVSSLSQNAYQYGAHFATRYETYRMD